MTPQEAHVLAKKFVGGNRTFKKCDEHSEMYLFYGDPDRIIPPIYVNKLTKKVGAFIPVKIKMGIEDYRNGKEVPFE